MYGIFKNIILNKIRNYNLGKKYIIINYHILVSSSFLFLIQNNQLKEIKFLAMIEDN